MRAAVVAAAVTALLVQPSNASQTKGAAPADVVKMGANVVTLESGATGCVVSSSRDSSGAKPLEIPGPCRFSRRGARAAPQLHTYPKVGSVMYVFGAPEPLEFFAGRAKVTASDLCSSHAQAVIVRSDGTLTLRPAKKNGVFCPNLGLDEKDFHGAAYPVR